MEQVDYSSWQLVRDILALLKPYKWRFFVASLIRFLSDLAELYPPFAFASVVTFATQYMHGASLGPLWPIFGWWLVAVLWRHIGLFYAKKFGYAVAETLSIDATLKTVRHLFLLDMAWHERENSGNKIKRIQNAGDGMNKIVRLWFDSIIEIAVNLIAINVIIAQFDRAILFLLLIFLVTYFVISTVMIKRAGEASYQVNKKEEEVSGLLFEAINNIRTVKVMAMAKTLTARLVDGTHQLFERLQIRIFWYQSRSALLHFLQSTFKIGVFVLIIKGILHGQYAVGFLILFNGYFGALRESVDELSTTTQDFVTARYSVARMQAILSQPITIDDEHGKNAFPRDWQKIEFTHVSFSYGQKKVLDDISFTVHRGEKIGIVGLSGAGKSTLFKLLLKEREEFTGDIGIDDYSIKQIRSTDYFRNVSVVLQDTEVFNFSLKDNITITNTKEKTNQRLLHQALTTAHISDFIHKLPDGLETVIGEKGFRLSGGERQRLGIARAIFKEPQILLLDEATSHLDLESEEKIQDSLHQFFEHVTAIVIAHRLTTIRAMDTILVIEDGALIESGNFEKLYASHGRFYELWEKQKL